jgi:Cu-processing system permease protein
MFARVTVIALNSYREAVRARVLHGLFGLALATGGYALVVGAFATKNGLRAVSDVGSMSISIYGIVVAIVLGATSLYREIELKTIFPVLARPLGRGEYLVGKYLGTVLTLFVFIAANCGALLLATAQLAGRSLVLTLAVGLGLTAAAALVAWRSLRLRTFVPIPWGLALVTVGWFLAAGAPDDRRVLLGSAVLTLCEVSVVTGIATVFAAFSSPFLTAIFTFSLFIVGRSADTLARLPERVFGETIKSIGGVLGKALPNLMFYVPPRPLLTGEQAGEPLGTYLLLATLHALMWSVGLLALASLIFRRRDFL